MSTGWALKTTGSMSGYLGPMTIRELIPGWESKPTGYVGLHRRGKSKRNRKVEVATGWREIWSNFKSFINPTPP